MSLFDEEKSKVNPRNFEVLEAIESSNGNILKILDDVNCQLEKDIFFKV